MKTTLCVNLPVTKVIGSCALLGFAIHCDKVKGAGSDKFSVLKVKIVGTKVL